MNLDHHLPAAVMADLYGYIHAHLSGDHDLADEELQSARRRLYVDGYTAAQAQDAIWAAIPRVRAMALQAVAEVAELTGGAS